MNLKPQADHPPKTSEPEDIREGRTHSKKGEFFSFLRIRHKKG